MTWTPAYSLGAPACHSVLCVVSLPYAMRASSQWGRSCVIRSATTRCNTSGHSCACVCECGPTSRTTQSRSCKARTWSCKLNCTWQRSADASRNGTSQASLHPASCGLQRPCEVVLPGNNRVCEHALGPTSSKLHSRARIHHRRCHDVPNMGNVCLHKCACIQIGSIAFATAHTTQLEGPPHTTATR